MNILHLSDIHFGRNQCGIPEPFEKKEIILNSLIEAVGSLDAAMRPDIILVTGDIAWKGRYSEFQEAEEWLNRLREELSLQPDQIVFCPGNHDLNRNVGITFSEEELLDDDKRLDIEKCDYYYNYDNSHQIEPRFYDYNLFCERMGMQPYTYENNGKKEYSYLIGHSQFALDGERYQIICFNTAYLPYGKVLKDDQMFLGLPQYQSMINQHVFDDGAVYRIALFHHAERYLHPHEQCEYNNRTATLPAILDHVDLALCGHTETEAPPRFLRANNNAYLLAAGATYYNDEHRNSFSIIHVEKGKTPVLCQIFYDGNRWKLSSALDTSSWSRSQGKPVWEDSVHQRKKMGFAIQIDGALKMLYYGHIQLTIGETEGKHILQIDNFVDPARSLDISQTLYSDTLDEPQVRIAHTPGNWKSIASLKHISEYHEFVADHIQGAKEVILGWVDPENSFKFTYSSSANLDYLRKEHSNRISTYSFYCKLESIEEYFGIRFRFPDSSPTRQELEAVEWLNEIKDCGSLHLKIDEIEESAFYVHNLLEIQWLESVSAREKRISYRFLRRVKYCLFHTEIDLGDCDLYLAGAAPKDIKDIRKKISTWEDGDVRKITTEFPDGAEIWIVPQNNYTTSINQELSKYCIVEIPKDARFPMSESMQQFIRAE